MTNTKLNNQKTLEEKTSEQVLAGLNNEQLWNAFRYANCIGDDNPFDVEKALRSMILDVRPFRIIDLIKYHLAPYVDGKSKHNNGTIISRAMEHIYKTIFYAQEQVFQGQTIKDTIYAGGHYKCLCTLIDVALEISRLTSNKISGRLTRDVLRLEDDFEAAYPRLTQEQYVILMGPGDRYEDPDEYYNNYGFCGGIEELKYVVSSYYFKGFPRWDEVKAAMDAMHVMQELAQANQSLF